MNIIAFFTEDGIPKTGLMSTVTIWDIVTGTAVATDTPMAEIAGGFYKYDFAIYDPTKDYAFLCDGGSDLDAGERWKAGTFGSNGDIAGIKDRTDHLPDDPASESATGIAVSKAETEIKAAVIDFEDTIHASLSGVESNIRGGSKTLQNISDEITSQTGTIEDRFTGIETTLALQSEDITFIKQIEGGRWVERDNQMIFYGPDNVAEIARFNLFNADGLPAMEGVVERVRVTEG